MDSALMVLDYLKSVFRLEIGNPFKLKNNKIIITLKDGTKARITTKNII